MSSKKTQQQQRQLDARSIWYMFLLSLQFGMQPSLTRRFTSSDINRSTVIIVQETVKFMIGLIMLVGSGGLKNALVGWSLKSWLTLACIPAALYSIQNLCALLAYQNLESVTFNVLNQTKTLSAALCCYLIMGKKQSRIQILALIILLTSALVLEKVISLDGSSSSSSSKEDVTSWMDTISSSSSSRHLTHGVIPVLTASFISGLAGALTQKNLQSAGGRRNAILFSMELCIASILILLSKLAMNTTDRNVILENGFFVHWKVSTLIPIFVNAMGGIVVGLVTKYAGAVRKGFALIFGLFLSGIIQAVLEGEDEGVVGISKEQVVGGVLASVSLWLYSTNPYVASVSSSETGPETAKVVDVAGRTQKRGKKSRKEE